MRLRVGAGRAHTGCFFGLVDESAVAAAPNDFAVLLKNLAIVQVFQQVVVALFMLFFQQC